MLIKVTSIYGGPLLVDICTGSDKFYQNEDGHNGARDQNTKILQQNSLEER